jgi:UDPglucose 6-dehydrogenase
VSNITVIGTGYVGMSLSVLLSKDNHVKAYDIDKKKVAMINDGKSPIQDKDIQEYLKSKILKLRATNNKIEALKNADFIIIATPTNYDPNTNYFDTSSVDLSVRDSIEINKEALIIIKSTIPIGHTNKLQEKFKTNKIIFSPEFLREGKALYDNLHPSRIVLGSNIKEAHDFAEILSKAASKKDIKKLFLSSSEAEAIKLFANTYLAMRVSFFNELDSFALSNDLDSKNIIEGVSSDDRIGSGYNNPSFGYGGYCLPKDTKQLLANYKEIPQSLISSIVESNSVRKDFIANFIQSKNPNSVGFYRLVMKKGSDNVRESASIGLIDRLNKVGIKTKIYEPLITDKYINESEVLSDKKLFFSESDLIVANRMFPELEQFSNKVITRDIFNEN